MQATQMIDDPCLLGEGPIWHRGEQKLYWTDIHGGRLLRYDPQTASHEEVYQGRPVGGFTVEADGSLLLFRDRGNIVRWHQGQVVQTIIEEIPGEEAHRFNDVIADPQGRVFCGTYSEAGDKGRLYRLEQDGSLIQILDNIGISNGMGFTPNAKQMYYTDTAAMTIYRFDYDRITGELTNQINWVEIPDGQGFPDGMTVDAKGNVWSAHWEGCCVICYDPQGKIIQKIKVPASKVTAVHFGGENLTSLFITSAGGDQRETDPQAGSLFCVPQMGIGLAEYHSAILSQI